MLTVFVVGYATGKLGLPKPMMLNAVMYAALCELRHDAGGGSGRHSHRCGVTLCIDTTLHLLADMLGDQVAEETARIMEYQRAWRANREGFAPAFDTKKE